MSNNTKQFKSWDAYTDEARIDDFQLPVSEDKTILVSALTGAGLLQFARAQRSGDIEAMLVVVCGDAWTDIEPLLAKAGMKAMENLLTDMMIHFDLAEEYTLIGQGGGKITEKDPRKIRALQKQGYRLEGEATSRI